MLNIAFQHLQIVAVGALALCSGSKAVALNGDGLVPGNGLEVFFALIDGTMVQCMVQKIIQQYLRIYSKLDALSSPLLKPTCFPASFFN